jgi:hypothetical protein
MRLRDRLPNYLTPGDITQWEQSPTVLIYKENTTYYARAETDGHIISSNTDFSTVCQAAGDWITENGVIFIKDPGSNIVITSTITFAGKDIFVTSDWAKLSFTALDNVVFLFSNPTFATEIMCGISNFRILGNETKVNQIFAKFSDVTAYVTNITNMHTDYVYCTIQLYGACYGSRIQSVQSKAKLPIEILGYNAGSDYEANATVVTDCNIGYRDGDYGIKVTYGNQIVIANTWFENCKTGIFATLCDALKIINSYFYSTVAAIDIDSYYCMITNNFFANQADSGVGVLLHSSYDGSITGNVFTSNNRASWNGIVLDTAGKVSIANNSFRQLGNPATTIAINSAAACNYNTITGNIFYNDNSLAATGIYLLSINYSTITSNTFYNYVTPINIPTVSNTIISENQGYKTENWGTSTGTGAQQTIAHGLAATPNNVFLTPTATGATEASLTAASDATNIFPTVTNLKTYQWYAEYI